jgi:predicted flap endonuclease-1-like 5' DNA nuclease
MRVLRVFFLGLLYGWLMRWIIDEIYTKDHLRMIANQNTLLRERIREMEGARSAALVPEQRTELMPAPLQRPEPREAPASPPASIPTQPPAKPVQRAHQKDDLKLIKGIGPQLEKKLNSAGVRTFDQMSRLTTAELQAILGISKRSLQNADNLISQAKKFSQDNANL